MNIHTTRASDRIEVSVPARPLDAAWGRLYTAAHYLNQADARDKICRAIQFASKFISNGEGGVAYNVEFSTALARKVFRLLKSVNELERLLAPHAENEGQQRLFLSKSMHGLMATYFLLDNVVWAGATGIFKNQQLTQSLSNFSLYFFMGGCACSAVLELVNLVGKKKEPISNVVAQGRVVQQAQNLDRDTYACLMRLARSSLDIVVGIGLLGLAPKQVTPRITGACGTLASLITCYEIYQETKAKVKIQ